MLSPLNVAIPATAATLVVPCSVAPALPVPLVIVRVTLPVKPVTALPCASRAVTTAANGAPAVSVAGGSVVKTSCVATPPVMLNAVLVALVRPDALTTNVYPVPVRLSVRLLKVATPATAATVSVPPRVAPLGFVPRASVTFPV